MSEQLEYMLEAERRGILPREQQALLDEARNRGLIDQRGNFAEALHTAQPEPKGTVYGPTFGRASQIESRPGALRAGLALALGTDEDIAREYAKVIPGAQATVNEDGRQLVQLENGDLYEVNPEGFDAGDALRFASKAASFLPASRLAGGISNVGGRALVGGGLSAATEGGSQLLVGRKSVDPLEAAVAGGAGAAGEILQPLVRAVFSGAPRLSRAEAVRRGQQVLATQAQGMPEEAVAQVGQRLKQLELGGKPEDLIGEAEFGFQYTRGQRTGDLKQLMDEERYGQSPVILQAQRQNADRANSAVQQLARRVAGSEVDTAPGAAARAADVVRTEQRALKGRVNSAYDRFRDTDAAVGPEGAVTLPSRVRDSLADFNIDPVNTPGAVRAMQLVDDAFAEPAEALSARRIDQVRRQLRTIGGSNPSDKKAVNGIIREMDAWLDDAVTNGIVTGDPKAIAYLKEARTLNRELAQRFGESGMGRDVDRIVGRMLRSDATPDELARMIYGATQVSPPSATRALQRIKWAMGAKPVEWNQLRAQVLRSAVTGKGDSPLGIQAIHSNLKELLINRPELMKTLFEPGELATVQRLTAAMEPLLRTVDKRSSGTTERLMRVMAPYVTKFPVIRQLFDYGAQAAEASGAQRILTPLAPPRSSAVPAVATAGASFMTPMASPYVNRPAPSNGR